MTKVNNFSLKERTISDCSSYAGSGNAGDFVTSTFDDTDICSSLDSFFTAVNSYHEAYACLDGLDLASRPLFENSATDCTRKN